MSKRVPMTPNLLETERKLHHDGCIARTVACEVAQAILADVTFWRERYGAAIRLAYELEAGRPAPRPPREP